MVLAVSIYGNGCICTIVFVMNTINFASSNKEKIVIAQTICEHVGLSINPLCLEIEEIQGEDPDLIIRDKAKRAYELCGEPVVVSDDTWDIKALNGFPGAYMKSVNHWFTPADFLRLMHGIDNRAVTLHQYLAYIDNEDVAIFTNQVHGRITTEARGGDDSVASIMRVTELDSDDGKTIAEAFEQDPEAIKHRYIDRDDAWTSLVAWYKSDKMK